MKTRIIKTQNAKAEDMWQIWEDQPDREITLDDGTKENQHVSDDEIRATGVCLATGFYSQISVEAAALEMKL